MLLYPALQVIGKTKVVLGVLIRPVEMDQITSHGSLTPGRRRVVRAAAAGDVLRPGLPASGMFVINPPHTLKAALKLALPQLVERLAQDKHAAFALDSGG